MNYQLDLCSHMVTMKTMKVRLMYGTKDQLNPWIPMHR